jgi:HSP20 family protein
MQRMMDDFLRGWWAPAWAAGSASTPALDVSETEADVIVKPEELDVPVTGNTLTIRGERKSERETKEGGTFRD